MIIARGSTSEGKDLLLLGLSNENLRGLVSGKPIKLNAETHPGMPEGLTIGIIYGQTEREMYNELRKIGFIGPETKVKEDPRL